MSIIISSDIEKIYEYVISKKFILKMFNLENKSDIIKKNEKYYFNKVYDYNELKHIDSISQEFYEIAKTKFNNIEIIINTVQSIIKKNDKCFIIKYSSVLQEPSYIKQFVNNIKVLLYVKFTLNTNDNLKTTVHFNQKIHYIKNDDDDDEDDMDNYIINNDLYNLNINNLEERELIFDENVLLLSETFLGKELVYNIKKFINSLFTNIIKDVFIKRFNKFFIKKNIIIYNKN